MYRRYSAYMRLLVNKMGPSWWAKHWEREDDL